MRGRREDRQDDRSLGRPGGGNHYQLRQTLVFEDTHDNELAKIQERMLRVKDSLPTRHIHL